MSRAQDQSVPAGFSLRLTTLMRQAANATSCVDEGFLREVGLYDEVLQAFARAGWSEFLTLRGDTCVEDTCEFLASVDKEGDAMRYRHRGVFYIATARQVADALGFREVTSRRSLDTHSDREFWRELTGRDDYRSGQSNLKEIIEPAWFYLAKLVSHSIVGRHGGSQKPGRQDLEVLRGMYYGRRVDFFSVMRTHWLRTKGRGTIECGGIITTLLQRLHGSDRLPDHQWLVPDPFSWERMVQMHCVQSRRDGTIVWKCGPNATQRTMRGAPEDSGEGSSAQPMATLPPPPVTQNPFPPEATYRNWMFNASRVLEYLAPPGTDIAMTPPAYWQPGLPVPPGYHLREHDNEETESDEDDDGFE